MHLWKNNTTKISEKLFKQLPKREVEKEGIIKEIKKREFYGKPSQLRRKKLENTGPKQFENTKEILFNSLFKSLS